ncbi:hypothetical protein [Novosphingobium sp. NDB2Meth1]|uniref:hypothetical protein n=1 Tax=Novosphingobium sp. NDB2Meth1 TaxID=1892847 RepID=UPI001160BB49|nr:hypothetical protein [Novosphingobium sp. NDB2Meth1]
MSFIEDDAEGSALESGIRDDELYKRAKILFEHAKSFFNKGATNSLLEMIRNNKVQGLGEFYTEDQFRAVKSQIYEDAMKVFDFLNANRSHGVSADFNNFIDALNFAFAFHLNAIKNDVSLSYAAPFPRLPRPTFHASRIQAMLERRSLPASLLIELNARKFVSGQAAQMGDMEAGVRDWIATLHDRAKTCRDYISPANAVSEISFTRQREINLLYRDIMVPTFNGIDSKASPSLRNIFSDHSSFKQRFAQDIEENLDLTRGLEDITPVIGSEELLSDLRLIDDPRIQRIRDRIIRSPKT